MPLRSIEESLLQMLNTTDKFALRSWKSNKASARRFSLQAFSWQTLRVQESHSLMNSGAMNSGAEKPH